MNVNNLFTVIVRTDSGLVSMLLMCEQGIWSYANTHGWQAGSPIMYLECKAMLWRTFFSPVCVCVCRPVMRRHLCTLQHPGQRCVRFNALNKSQMDYSALVSVLITLTFRDLLKAHQRYYSNISSHVVLFPPKEGISECSDGWCEVSQGWWQSLFISPCLP